MKKGFVKTENFKRLAEAQKLVERRGAREAGLVLVKGHYGIGKSELTERWAADSSAGRVALLYQKLLRASAALSTVRACRPEIASP